MTSLIYTQKFNLTDTYFLIAGIASINPKIATINSVTFAQFAIQVGLQHEIDAREMPTNLSTGYIPLGSTGPAEYPRYVFGTEVFELNDGLRLLAADLASNVTLNDTDDAIVYRTHYYTSDKVFQEGTAPPTVVLCDSITSDVWFSGSKLAESFDVYARLISNGKATYCSAAQEDNAILAALFRGAKGNLVDFNRIIVMRSGSDFDRPYRGQAPEQNLFWPQTGGHGAALKNLYLAGAPVIKAIITDWNARFEKGIVANNYVGDILGTLGGTPDFGPSAGKPQ